MPADPIAIRWHAYWRAREAGADDAWAYDRYVHPDTRLPLTEVLTEHPEHEGGHP